MKATSAGFPFNDAREIRSEEHTSELQSRSDLVCRLLLEKKEHTSELQSRSDIVCGLLLVKRKNKVFIYQVYILFTSVHFTFSSSLLSFFFFFFLKETAPPEISPLPLHAALPI